MTAALVDRVAKLRLTPAQYVEMVAAPRLGRRDRLVLHAIARRAHYQSWRWGEGSIRCVENIARDIGYCERSVQYAYRSLQEAGWLRIDPRPGRTNHFTILRPVEPLGLVVDDAADPVDNVGDNRPPEADPVSAPVASGGAAVAPDLETPTSRPTPVAPNRAWGKSDGAAAPAQPAPQWRRDGPAAAAETTPPPPAGHRARPHRQDAGRQRAPAAPPSSSEDVFAVLSSAVTDLGDLGAGDPLPAGHWTREAARQLRPCPRCSAVPGEACRNRAGRLRKANHRERSIPR